MKEYKNLTRIQKKKKMPSGGPEFYADMKYKNAIVEHVINIATVTPIKKTFTEAMDE